MENNARGGAKVNTDASREAIIQAAQTFFQCLPTGFRFKPTDQELLGFYLKNKVLGAQLPPHNILDVNIYDYEPRDLKALYPLPGQTEWYFFTPRERKYPNGKRPNRRTGGGHWKATGRDDEVKNKSDEKVGFKKTLVYMNGKSSKGKKSNWIMHEYTLDKSTHEKEHVDDMKLDAWVLCRIYERKGKSKIDQDQAMPSEDGGLEDDTPLNHESNTDADQNKGQLSVKKPRGNYHVIHQPTVSGFTGNSAPQALHSYNGVVAPEMAIYHQYYQTQTMQSISQSDQPMGSILQLLSRNDIPYVDPIARLPPMLSISQAPSVAPKFDQNHYGPPMSHGVPTAEPTLKADQLQASKSEVPPKAQVPQTQSQHQGSAASSMPSIESFLEWNSTIPQNSSTDFMEDLDQFQYGILTDPAIYVDFDQYRQPYRQRPSDASQG